MLSSVVGYKKDPFPKGINLKPEKGKKCLELYNKCLGSIH